MKKILFITPFVPSDIGAGVKYTKSLIEDLSQTCKIDIVLFRNKSDNAYVIPNSNVSVIKEYKVTLFYKLLNAAPFFFLFPLFTAKFSFPTLFFLRKRIKVENYDFVYFDFSQTFLYSKCITHPRMILMSHDVITQRYARSSNAIVQWFCRKTEQFVLKGKNKKIYTFSEKDNILLKNLFHIEAQNTCFYIPVQALSAVPNAIGDYVCFFAMWKRADNHKGLVWFLDNVADRIPYRILIIGGGMPQNIEMKISLFKNVMYLGFIDNPYSIISNSLALISPLFTGAGVKVKVIEALACGTPVIGTQISFEGISNNYKEFMLVAESAADYIHQIKSIDYSLSTRQKFKNKFCSTYNEKSIANYITNVSI